jgi:hypothetical protein
MGLTCRFPALILSRAVRGELPDMLDFPPERASGVLCSQVIHFLRPSLIPETFENLAQVGRAGQPPGGGSVLSCVIGELCVISCP